MAPIEDLPAGLSEAAILASQARQESVWQQLQSPLPPNLPRSELKSTLQNRLDNVELVEISNEKILQDLESKLQKLVPLISDIASNMQQLGLSPEQIDAAAIAAIGLRTQDESEKVRESYTGQEVLEAAGFDLKGKELLRRLKDQGILQEGTDFSGKGFGLKYTPDAVAKLSHLHEVLEKSSNKAITNRLINQAFPPPDTSK